MIARGSFTMRQPKRRGSATVELSICLPLFVIVMTGTIETCSLIHLRESLCVASYEAARVVAKGQSNEGQARTRATSILEARGIHDGNVTFEPPDLSSVRLGDPITVRVSIPSKGHSLPSQFLGETEIVGKTVVFKERD